VQQALRHELGHVAGLAHADALGEPALSVMTWEPAADDPAENELAAAGEAMSESHITWPSHDESTAFRFGLEQVFAANLGTAPVASHVDLESAAVWLTEYVRYRVHGCDHTRASALIARQLAGGGAQPGCMAAMDAPVPSRDEALAFRLGLEARYRDELRRGATSTAAAVESEVRWMLEYLGQRRAGCSHDAAARTVLTAVAGGFEVGSCAASSRSADDPALNPSMVLFSSAEHARLDGYELAFIDDSSSIVHAVPIARAQVAFRATDLAIDLRVAPSLPRGQVLRAVLRGNWPGGFTDWSAPSNRFILTAAPAR
jgi:hypothetical protein